MEISMRKNILTILGSSVLSSVLAVLLTQAAAAAEHHKDRNVVRAPAQVSEQFRNANDVYARPVRVQPDWSRYEDGAMSAPAGH
jgi:hypothetical protein